MPDSVVFLNFCVTYGITRTFLEIAFLKTGIHIWQLTFWYFHCFSFHYNIFSSKFFNICFLKFIHFYFFVCIFSVIVCLAFQRIFFPVSDDRNFFNKGLVVGKISIRYGFAIVYNNSVNFLTVLEIWEILNIFYIDACNRFETAFINRNAYPIFTEKSIIRPFIVRLS